MTNPLIRFNITSHAADGYGPNGGGDVIFKNLGVDLISLLEAYGMQTALNMSGDTVIVGKAASNTGSDYAHTFESIISKAAPRSTTVKRFLAVR